MYFVYIIRSERDGTYYTGMTEDVRKRFREHNRGLTKSSRSHKPWKIIYVEECVTRAQARKREKYWKSGAEREEREGFS